MKKLGLMLCLAFSPLLGAGCSSSGDTSDGAASDGQTGGDASGVFFLSRGMNNYTVTAVSGVNDGCMAQPSALLNMTLPVNAVDSANMTMLTVSVGNQVGSPVQASLGSGNVAGTMATLMRENDVTDLTCTWHQKDVSVLTLIGNDTFTLAVTETQSAFTAACTPIPTGGMCTSTFTLTLTKAAATDGGSATGG